MTVSIQPADLIDADRTRSVSLYSSMVRIRVFEEQARRLFAQGADGFRGALHDGIGQEAVTVGVIAALKADDQVLSTHRCHGQVITKGAPIRAAFAEILGRSTGLCSGKGGSMHLASVQHGHFGCTGIVGAHLPVANGMALTARMQGTDRVIVCFFGDGATNIGAFHEALNLAALWQLPVMFVCENNQYTEQTRGADLTTVAYPAADRASSYGMPRQIVDGNDVEAVFDMAAANVDAMRRGGGPALIEAVTYRVNGHSLFDAGKYRLESEVAEWKAKDPLLKQRRFLDHRGVPAAQLDEIERDIATETTQALAQAKSDPHASPDQLLTDLWSDGGASWRS